MSEIPGSDTWDPDRQRAIVLYLVEAAVETLPAAGADPGLRNDGGSTAADLVGMTTGRGGTGSAGAKAEQAAIVELLTR